MPKTLSKSDLLRLKVSGAKFDDGSEIDLEDKSEETSEENYNKNIASAFSDLADKTSKMITSLSDLHQIVGHAISKLAESISEQSASIEKLANGMKHMADMKPMVSRDNKPREYIVQRGNNGRIEKIITKEV